jgi:hypothetical protein
MKKKDEQNVVLTLSSPLSPTAKLMKLRLFFSFFFSFFLSFFLSIYLSFYYSLTMTDSSINYWVKFFFIFFSFLFFFLPFSFAINKCRLKQIQTNSTNTKNLFRLILSRCCDLTVKMSNLPKEQKWE